MRLIILFLILFSLPADFILAQNNPEADTSKAKILLEQGDDLSQQGKFGEASELYKKGAALFESAGRQEDYLDLFFKYTWTSFRIGNYQQVRKDILEKIDQIKAIPERNKELDILLAEGYYQMTAVANRSGEYAEAIEWADQCIEIRKLHYPADHIELGKIYNATGITHFFYRDYETALDYYKRSLSIREKLYGSDHPRVATVLNNMGNCYMERGLYEKARKTFQRSLDIKKIHLPEQHPSLTPTLNNLGMIYFHQEKWDSSLIFMQMGLDIEKAVFGPGHPEIGDKLGNIAALYRNKKEPETALEYSKDAVEIFEKTLGPNNNRVARAQMAVASTLSELDRLDEALIEAQRAVKIMYPELDSADLYAIPELSNDRPLRDELEVISRKGQIHLHRYKKNQKLKDLETARAYYQQAIKALEVARQEMESESSKFRLMFDYGYYYEEAIDIAMLYFEREQDQQYLEEVFNLFERSKSAVLRGSLQARTAIQYAGIPEAILEQETDFKGQIADVQEAIVQAESQSQKDSLMTQLSNYRLEYMKFIQGLEQKHPNYYATKFDIKHQDLASVQEFLRAENKQILSYFMGPETQFVCMISGDSIAVKQLDLPVNFRDQVESYYSKFSDRDRAFNQARSMDLFKKTAQEGKALFDAFIPFDLNPDQGLIIVPDGSLHYLPFDLLIRSEATEDQELDYSSLDFLIQTWPIQYAYSTTLWMDQDQKKRRNANLFGGFSAYYPIVSGDQIDSRTHGFEALEFADEEVESIAYLLGGQAFTEVDSVEQIFKDQASNFQVLHLAMHAFTDDFDPLRSGLVFATPLDSEYPDILYAHELYGMQIDAELVVLSACNTGIGPQTNGDGLMSMGRAFRHAGCSNILMSLWQSDDQSTRELMIRFYEGLQSGISKEEALRQAKLSLLNDPRTSFPHFWSTFSIWGNSENLNIKPKSNWFSSGLSIPNFLIFGGLILSLFFFFFAMRSFQKN